MAVTLLQVFQEFAAFLHYCQVCGVYRIEYVVESDLPQGTYELAHGAFLLVEADGLSPGRPHCGSDLDYRCLVRIGDGFKGSLRIRSFPESSYRAVGQTLSAVCAVSPVKRRILRYAYGGPVSAAGQVPYMHVLYLVAHLYASHALDALRSVPDQRAATVPALFLGDVLVRYLQYTQVVGQLLQVAVAAPVADGTFAVVVRQDQFDIDAPCPPDARAVGIYPPRRLFCGHIPGMYLHTHGLDGVYIPLQSLTRQTVLRYAVSQHASGLAALFENMNLVTHQCQEVRRRQSAGTAAYDSDLFVCIIHRRWHEHRLAAVVYGETFEPSDIDRSVYQLPAASLLARMLAYQRAYGRERVVFSYETHRIVVSACQYKRHVSRNIHSCRTSCDAGHRLLGILYALGASVPAHMFLIILSESRHAPDDHVRSFRAYGTVS